MAKKDRPKTRVSSDQPALVDELGYFSLVKEIGQSIEYCELPQVFGLHGDWGAGKTSLLHQIHFYLSGKCPQQDEDQVATVVDKKKLKPSRRPELNYVVWFEAWKYQNEDVPVVALLHEIRQQLSRCQTAKGQMSKLASTAIKGFLFSIEGLTEKIGFQASKIQAVKESWEKEHLASKLPSDNIRQLLQRAINGLIGNDNKKNKKNPNRLVVLIDDLDRCEPDAAYKLLEGLKIYLTINNAVFVLGMNQRIVEDAIAKNISVESVPDDQKQIVLKDRSAAYMEKICQNIWRMPLVKNPVEVLLKFLDRLTDSETIQPAVKQAFSDLSPCLPPNPRRLRAFANLIRRHKLTIDKLTIDKITSKRTFPLLPEKLRTIRLLLVAAYIYQFHHDIYRRWCLELSLFEVIRIWCHDQEGSQAKTRFEKLFPHVTRGGWNAADPTAPVASPVYQTAFPDPAESNVFWIQPMIMSLGDTVDPLEFKPFLNIS